MRNRLLLGALAYAVFLLVLFLLPPFHDGHHHLYSWQPTADQAVLAAPAMADGDWIRAHIADLSRPDVFRLLFESAIGLAFAVLLSLLLEFIARVRAYLQADVPFARPTLLGFLFTVS